jgi:hypothetical protein
MLERQHEHHSPHRHHLVQRRGVGRRQGRRAVTQHMRRARRQDLVVRTRTFVHMIVVTELEPDPPICFREDAADVMLEVDGAACRAHFVRQCVQESLKATREIAQLGRPGDNAGPKPGHVHSLIVRSEFTHEKGLPKGLIGATSHSS